MVIGAERAALVVLLRRRCNSCVRFEIACARTIAAHGRPARLQWQKGHQKYEKQAAHGGRLYQFSRRVGDQQMSASVNVFTHRTAATTSPICSICLARTAAFRNGPALPILGEATGVQTQ